MKLRKDELVREPIKILEYVISSNGPLADPDKVACVANARLPLHRKELRSFFMSCSFNSRFISGFSHIAAPLHEMVGNDARFVWTQDATLVFRALEKAMSMPPVLGLPNMKIHSMCFPMHPKIQ